MYRVLKPEGKVVILELSVPDNPFIRWCYRLYFLNILPAIGGFVSGNRSAYRYLLAPVLKFPEPDKFIAMMEAAGFRHGRHKSFTFGICRMYVGTHIRRFAPTSPAACGGAGQIQRKTGHRK